MSTSTATSNRIYTINDLKYFLHTCTINEHFNPAKSNAYDIIDYLIKNGKGKEIIKEINDYSTLNSSINSTNIDATTYVLAVCVTLRKSEELTNAAYNALKEISETPLHLFAFIYYHKFLLDELKRTKQEEGLSEEDIKKQFGKGWGKGQRKAVIKWYNDHSEEDILRFVTKYRRSHTWSHKDIIKIAHIKPANNRVALIFKYLMFGYEKIKNDKLTDDEKCLFEFIEDYEKLKLAQNGTDAASLIRKHKFHLEHLPSKLHKAKEIWEALIEDMSVQQFCSYIGVVTSKGLLKHDTNSSKHVLEKILTKEQITLSKIHPIQPCLALQVYLKVNQLAISQNTNQQQQQDSLVKALFDGFQLSLNSQNLSSTKRIACIVEMNSFMLNGATEGLRLLNAIDTATSIVLTLHSTEKNCDVFVVNDKVNKANLPAVDQIQNLNSIENVLKQFPPTDSNANDSIFDWCTTNKKQYDCFIFLLSSRYDEKKLVKAIDEYRTKTNLTNAKLVLISLTDKLSSQTVKNLNNLHFKSWNIDSYLVLQSYLNDKF